VKLDELFIKMRELCGGANPVRMAGRPDPMPDVLALRYDSRKVTPGSGIIYACVRGERVDGHNFAADAARSGAVALLCDHPLPLDAPQIIAENVRFAMGEVSAVLRGNPSEKLRMIGVTGTNGKTTTAYITRSIMRAGGIATGMIGTVVYDDCVFEVPADRTTPEGPDIQDMLARMAEAGAECCVMEASSHGLEQGRLAGCKFDAVGFGNLTPEHLEFHGSMEKYFAAKRRLFAEYTKAGWTGSANADDEYGRLLLGEFPGQVRPFTADAAPEFPGAYAASGVSSSAEGMTFELAFPDGESCRIESPLIGGYNVSNILEAAALADSLGVSRESIIRGVSRCPQVPGRLERYTLGNGVRVFVDFAHSSDGMEKMLSALYPLKERDLCVLWGAGGERTPLKRPAVGSIMAKYADYIIISTDNPRSESPEAIARDVESGVISGGGESRYGIILDRKEAIYRALDGASPGDIVVIAGKGPESYIDYGTHRMPFSDSGTVLEWAAERGVGMRDS
jgi:UDP-N-acetylmuramoyl-L-alanyl-D-glutamate--2,6-diaminopimelate ligase